MSWVNPAGVEVDRPAERRARGRNLSLEGAIRLRDLLALMLVLDLGLSVVDALAVLGLGAITEQHLRRRLKAIPPTVRSGFAELRREVHGL